MSEQTCPEDKLWTPANIVTLTRILLVPVFVVALLSPWPDYFPHWDDVELFKPWLAAFLFTILACTDALDGYLARSRGEITNFGKFMDPLADKILVASALLALVELQVLPSWVALVILVREFIVSGLRMVAASKGIVIAASWYGKAKTVFQIIAIILFIIKQSELLLSIHGEMGTILYIVSWTVMAIALILTVLSMLDYFVKAGDVLGFKSRKKEHDDFFISTSEAFQPNEETYFEQAKEVVELAKQNKVSLCTAESCTGGLIAGALTSVSGSSAVVNGGIVSYANEVKEHSLGVSSADLQQYGAVSSQVAEQMACGAHDSLRSDIAVSVTGIAGPGGGTKEKPVGTVWFGVCSSRGTKSKVMHFEGDREGIRSQTVSCALKLFKDELNSMQK